MKRFKVNVYICPEENTIDFEVGSAVYPIGFTEVVGCHLVPEYLHLLSCGTFIAVSGEEANNSPRGFLFGVWEIESGYDLDKVLY